MNEQEQCHGTIKNTPAPAGQVERVVMCGSGCGCEFDPDYIENNFYKDIKKQCCPKCGCTKVTSIGNTQDQPDNYTEWNCIKCNHLIAEIDNSPLYVCWDFENDTI